MNFRTQDIEFGAAASTTQTIPISIARLVSAASFGALGTAGDTETAMTVTTGTPGAAGVQFTGSANSPSTVLTLGTAAVAGQILKLRAVVPGDIPATI